MDTHSSVTETQFDVMRSQISSSFEKAQAQKKRLKRKNARYTNANIILAGLSTLLAGMAGTIGNAKNWKPVYMLAAICSAGVTVTSRLQTAERLTTTSECMGQLKALRVETIAPTYDLPKVSAKYQQILSEYSAIDV
ncbi:MAG: hypothetical protein KME42_05945 [Tildeniella nuda ZEHNDER 1965/U140]|jgi:hypothetical protein|nr:hypothetical protein [Tildeniella nuda ZEHNDER 1965/U140]